MAGKYLVAVGTGFEYPRTILLHYKQHDSRSVMMAKQVMIFNRFRKIAKSDH
jgi:hypothetical protein